LTGVRTREPWTVLAVILLGLFAVGFNMTLISNSLLRIADDLDSDTTTITWAITGPLLATAVLGPTAGKLVDRHGARRMYRFGLAGAGLFSVASALAPTPVVLIGSRTLSSALGALVMPAALSLINRIIPADRRARAMGYWTMVGAGGPVVGVVAGGPLVEAFGWRWIFAVQAPVVLATIALAVAVLPRRDTTADTGPFDVAGAAALGGAVLTLLLGLNRGSVLGWTHPLIVACFVASPLFVAWFLRVERTAIDPLLSLDYLRLRAFRMVLVAQFGISFAYMGSFILAPQLLQSEFGYTEGHTGLLLIARPLTFAIAGPLLGTFGARIPAFASAAGASGVAVSMIAIGSLAPGHPDWLIAASLALAGFGFGICSPAMTVAVIDTVAADDVGVAGATLQSANMVGTVVGIQTLQTVQAAGAGLSSYSNALYVGCVVAALAAIAGFRVEHRSRRTVTPTEVAPAAAP
jgi:MFS family permease